MIWSFENTPSLLPAHHYLFLTYPYVICCLLFPILHALTFTQWFIDATRRTLCNSLMFDKDVLPRRFSSSQKLPRGNDLRSASAFTSRPLRGNLTGVSQVEYWQFRSCERLQVSFLGGWSASVSFPKNKMCQVAKLNQARFWSSFSRFQARHVDLLATLAWLPSDCMSLEKRFSDDVRTRCDARVTPHIQFSSSQKRLRRRHPSPFFGQKVTQPSFLPF